MTDTNHIINWDNLLKASSTFKKNKPFKWCFVEEFINRDFYEKLYQTYPKHEDGFEQSNMFRRTSKHKILQERDEKKPVPDKVLSKEWNEFKMYMNSKEFLDNFTKFSGIKITKTLMSSFVANTKGDFQLPHIDYDGKYSNKLQIMVYFTKGWQKGDPGGTFVSTGEDESSIIFEPYNLDNSMLIFEETPKSWHGTRYITKDGVRRQALAISLT